MADTVLSGIKNERHGRPGSFRHTVIFCLFGIAFMLAMAYASVPLYNLFCRVTGYAGTTNRAETAPAITGKRIMTMRFDANVNRDMPWIFNAPDEKFSLNVGETGIAFYRVHNPTNETIIGTASYNVTPQKAGYYFAKIDCFCFTEQVLEPGQTVDMPVTFFIDPEIENDPDMRDVKDMTLSYTFFRLEKTANEKSIAQSPKG